MAEVAAHPAGRFCWIELGTTDQNAAKDFYGKLFGWTFEDMPMGPGGVYTIFRLKGRDVAAGYTLDPKQMPGVPPHFMLYVASDDVDATARKASELGAQVMAEPFDVFEAGRMAVLKDPTGATFCAWQAKANQGIGIQNEHGAFCWGQLNTNDTARAEVFYTALFGWTGKTGTGGGMTYTEWSLGAEPFAGMMTMPPDAGSPPHWLAYFAVDDCDAIATQASALGARTYVPPTDLPGVGRFAVLADPQGAIFALYRSQ